MLLVLHIASYCATFIFQTRPTENEPNLSSAELLLTDKEVLEQLEERSFFQAAQALYVPAALLDYKFRAMCEKGILNQTMDCRDSRYLKGKLGAYDVSYRIFES